MTAAVIVTRLHGTVSRAEVEAWAAALQADVDAVPDGSTFRLLFDLTGYEPADLEAHKAMRLVVPELLARHGMRPAVADLFPELPPPAVTVERGVVVERFANVHHDPDKMGRYEAQVSTPAQRFFTDRSQAEAWLRGE